MIRIQAFNAHPKHKIRYNETIRLARHVVKEEHRKHVELNIIYIDDQRMENMNDSYLKHRYSTDVLSFSLAEIGNKKIEGEVYVNLDRARSQARQYQVTIKNEIARLVIHGILHLLGYDDKSVRAKSRMTKLENLYLAKCGYATSLN